MRIWSKWAASALTLIALQAGVVRAQAPEPRLALVIGESAYPQNALPTAANDAGLIASTLSAEGFDVTGARDLDDESLRKSLREFLDKAAAAGPNAVVFVYIAGQGLQLEGENYLVPVGASIARDTDVPANAYRLSDFTRALDGIPLKARIVVLDAAHANNFAKGGQPIAAGLAITDPAPGSLIAYNATPDTVAPDQSGTYGVYAQALNEMLHQAGMPLDEVFNDTRLRVNELSKGALTPWDADKVTVPFVFLERGSGAPVAAVSDEQRQAYDTQPISQFSADDAYYAALDRDTIDAYQDFLVAFPNAPQAGRVRVLLAVRREAVTWRITYRTDRPNAYWSYLRRYPSGPHAWDAHRRLGELRAELTPPETFDFIRYDVPPPPPEEIVIINRPVLIFEADGPPPPPPPRYFIEPGPREVVAPPPPEPGAGRYILPLLPAAAAIATIPLWAHVPKGVPEPRRAEGAPLVRPPGVVQQNPAGPPPVQPPPGKPPVAPGAPQPLPPQPGAPSPRQHVLPTPGVPGVRTLPQPGVPQPGVPGVRTLPQAGAPQPGVPGVRRRLPPGAPGAPAAEGLPGVRLAPGQQLAPGSQPVPGSQPAPGQQPAHVMPAAPAPQVHVPPVLPPAAPVHVAPPAAPVHVVPPPAPQVHVPPPAAPIRVAPHPAPVPPADPAARAPGGHPPQGGPERRCGHPGEPPCH
ncbi:caspase family protein [Methylovirgula sp. 4M-Z18]|uniref:caspase family protein n=1 Tax=Methylovirgula sp. 4M-Z18 TaxID=2293567 RepID=UPI000E2EE921|nr:caspase family protein [Methylovirgula sp. 4M-Z18]RFB80001.1 caspase-like domain-containing protein [Methylovirgula sp. 4M-Z18]